jgi:hypothetical protein
MLDFCVAVVVCKCSQFHASCTQYPWILLYALFMYLVHAITERCMILKIGQNSMIEEDEVVVFSRAIYILL